MSVLSLSPLYDTAVNLVFMSQRHNCWPIYLRKTVTLSSDVSLYGHVSIVSASCFYWLRQLRRCRRSLDAESAATLVHAFCSVAHRLTLSWRICSCAENDDRQVAASVERCGSSGHRHKEVRARLVAASSH